MAMILPFTTSLPPESPYTAPEPLPRQEMKTEETASRDAVRDRKDDDLESSPDDDDFATIMGLLLAGSNVTSAANETTESPDSGKAARDTAEADAITSAGAATADRSQKKVDFLSQSTSAAAALTGENNAEVVNSEQAAAALVKQNQLAVARESAMTGTEDLITGTAATSALDSQVPADDRMDAVAAQTPPESTPAATPVATNPAPEINETQATSEFQTMALPNENIVDSLEPLVAPDSFPTTTTFASVSEQLQSADFQAELAIQNPVQETRSGRSESSSSGSAIKSIARTRSSGGVPSLLAAANRGNTEAAAATVNENLDLNTAVLQPADPLLDVFSASGINDTRDIASRIERTIKAAEASVQPLTSNTIQDSLQQFWTEHSAGGNSHERSPSNSGEAELAAIGGTQSSSDASRNAAAGATAVTSQVSSSELAMTATTELRQPLSAQVSQAVLEHLQNQSAQKNEALTVRLDPPELGEMVIEISRASDGLAVRVTAREPVTMDMLLARGREIEVQLRGEQLDLSSLEFLSPGMSGGASSHDSSSRDTSAFSEGNAHSSRRSARTTASGSLTSTPLPARVISNGPLSFRA